MQANVTTVEVPAELFDAVAATVNTHIVPVMRNWSGFMGTYWFGDRSEGLVRAVVFFDSADASHASRDHGELSPVQSLDAALSAVGGRVTIGEEYEVVAATGPHVSRTAQFCRSLAWQEDPQQIEHAIRHIEAGVIPGVRQNPGFQGGFWLMDRLTGGSMGFTLWDTVEHLQASGEVGRQMRRGPIQRGQMQVLGLHEDEIIARAEAP
jgi:hypothetical protein